MYQCRSRCHMSRLKKPAVGDDIVHEEPEWSRVTEGKVVQLLSAFFVYVTQDGTERSCLYKDTWRKTSA